MRKLRCYVEVLLESIGEAFTNLEEVEFLLHRLLGKHEQDSVNIIGEIIDNDHDKSLYIYFVPDGNKHSVLTDGKKYYEDKELISSWGSYD